VNRDPTSPQTINVMKLLAAFSFLVAAVSANSLASAHRERAAQTAYVGRLMRGAVPTNNSQLRRLEQNNGQNMNYEIDISGYSVKFEQCQLVKSFDEDLAGQEDASTVLATKRFAIFRLCPNNACSSCNYNYGEYLVDLDTYLQATVEYLKDYQEEMCNTCNECQNTNDDQNNGGRQLQNNQNYNVDCSTCYTECQKIANMETNGYLDATNFLECQLIYSPQDDSVADLYAGPICASQGSKIKIGVFTDQYCTDLDASKDPDDYLVSEQGTQMKLSHALLKLTYMDTCISCKEPQNANNNDQGNDAQDADDVIEMCETLYNSGAKCETTHGFNNGVSNYNGYENQLAQEEVVCDFVQSLKSGTYDESGEIIVSGASSSIGGGNSTTGGQKFALCFFILGTIGLAVYAGVLHSKLTKGSVNFSSNGGNLA
jgi:hypothetical protein